MPKHVQKRTPKPTTEGRGKRNPRAVQEEGDRGLSPSDLESIAKLVAAKLKGAEVGGTPEPTPGPSHEGSGSNLEVSALSDLATLTDLPDPGMSTRQMKDSCTEDTCTEDTYTEDTCTVNTCTQNGTCPENTYTKDTCKENDTCICGTGMCTCTFLKEECGWCKYVGVITYEGLRLQSVSGGAFLQPDKEGKVVAKHLGESCRLCWFIEKGRYRVAITFKKTDTTVWCMKAETENTLQFVEVRPPTERSPSHAIDGYIFNITMNGPVAIFESAQFHGRFIKYNQGKGSEIRFGLVNLPPCKPGCFNSPAYDGCRFGLYSSS